MLLHVFVMFPKWICDITSLASSIRAQGQPAGVSVQTHPKLPCIAYLGHHLWNFKNSEVWVANLNGVCCAIWDCTSGSYKDSANICQFIETT